MQGSLLDRQPLSDACGGAAGGGGGLPTISSRLEPMKSSADGDGSQHDGSNNGTGRELGRAARRDRDTASLCLAPARSGQLGDLLDQLRVGLAALLRGPRQILAVGQVGIGIGLDDVNLVVVG